MTQEELAAAAEVSRVTLSRLENGVILHPWGETLFRVATALGVRVETLLEEEKS